jgi:hypothetical protein
MTKAFAILSLLGAAASCPAQTIEMVAPKAGDSWIYKNTTERPPPVGFRQSTDEISVERVTPSAIYVTTKQMGSPQPPRELLTGLDWSRIRDVNGKETVVNRPLAFPLTPGKSWDVQFTELNPNRNNKSEQWTVKYTVTGYETIQVAAGSFKALKIEAEGRWVAERQPGTTVVQGATTTPGGATMSTDVQKASDTPISGRIYKAFWYVPEVRRWVKSVEELYSSTGVRNERVATELESFKLVDGAAAGH